MTNKELSMRLKTAGFTLKGNAFSFHCKKCNVYEPDRYTMTSTDGSHEDYYHCVKCNTELDMVDLYDAEVLYEWLRGWHRDDPFRSFGIENDGITAFDWGPRDNAKWIEYETSLADMLAEAILWVLEDDDAQTKD